VVRRDWLPRPNQEPGSLPFRHVDVQNIASAPEEPSRVVSYGSAESVRDLLIGQARLDPRREHAAEDEKPLSLNVESFRLGGPAKRTFQHGGATHEGSKRLTGPRPSFS
jgi:hypothetical protein